MATASSYRTPLLSESSSIISTSSSSESEESPATSQRYNDFQLLNLQIKISRIPNIPCTNFHSYKSLAVLSGHVGTVSCLALCGEFILSASQGKDIIVWQQPDLRQFTKFGTGDGFVKALVTVGNKVFTALKIVEFVCGKFQEDLRMFLGLLIHFLLQKIILGNL